MVSESPTATAVSTVMKLCMVWMIETKLLFVNLQVQLYGIVVKSTGHKLWRSDQQSVHGGSSPDQDTFILE